MSTYSVKRRIARLLTVFFVTLTACGGGDGSARAPEPILVPVQTITVGSAGAINALNGVEDIVGVVYTDVSNVSSNSGFKETLRLFRQDSANADLLIEIGDVYLGVDTLYKRVSDITASTEWIAVTMNHNDFVQGWVALVSLTDNTYSLDGLITFDAIYIEHAVAKGTQLLISYNNAVELYDISAINAPIKTATFVANGTVRSITAFPFGFFVTTSNGFGYVDVSEASNPVFSQGTDLDIKDAAKVYYANGKLYMGGSSKNAGKSKIARLDVTIPSNPQVELINDVIEGNFIDFAFDGMGRYYLLTDISVSYHVQVGASLETQDIAYGETFSFGKSQFHAWNGRFYIIEQGLNVYNFDHWIYV